MSLCEACEKGKLSIAQGDAFSLRYKALSWAMDSCPFGVPPRINALTEKCRVLAVLFAQATTGVVAPPP